MYSDLKIICCEIVNNIFPVAVLIYEIYCQTIRSTQEQHTENTYRHF